MAQTGKGRGRDVARLLTPPILLAAARRLAGRRAGPPDRLPSALQGPFATWAEAVAEADGWESPAIVARTRELGRQLQRGEIAFQQDALVHPRIRYSPAILALIAMLAARSGGRVDVIDVGGSIATNYQQNHKVLAPFLARGACRWRVVETPAMAALGRAEFAAPGLAYFDSWEAALAEGGPAAGVLFGSSLQSLADPWAALAAAAEAGAELIAADRLLLMPGLEDRIFVQHTEPDRYGGATVAVRALARAPLVERMAGLGFALAEAFSGPRAGQLWHESLLFARGA
jgi:putative methyltransferase (TIGR04325 family)